MCTYACPQIASGKGLHHYSHSCMHGLATQSSVTRAQVMTKWALWRGTICLPRSNSAQHIEENLTVPLSSVGARTYSLRCVCVQFVIEFAINCLYPFRTVALQAHGTMCAAGAVCAPRPHAGKPQQPLSLLQACGRGCGAGPEIVAPSVG